MNDEKRSGTSPLSHVVAVRTVEQFSKDIPDEDWGAEHAAFVADGWACHIAYPVQRDGRTVHITHWKRPVAVPADDQKWRANYIPAPHFYNLNQACALINKAFGGFGCYLVGSSRKKRDYRDVDVRLILDDAEYDRLFKSTDGMGWVNPFWSLLCTSISLWLRQQTDLPIDFQIQRQTQANKDHPGAGNRAALGIFLDYPGERPSENNPPAVAEVSNGG